MVGRPFKGLLWLAGVGVLSLIAAACGGGSSGGPSPTSAIGSQAPLQQQSQKVNVVAGSIDFAVGENRFSFALFDFDGAPIEGARAEVAFGPVQQATVTIKSVAQATYRRAVTQFPHVHAGGEVHPHEEARGIYVVDKALFETAGVWGARVRFTGPKGGAPLSGTLAFEVNERSATPAVGDPAPPSRNPTAADVADLSEIDSSNPPRPELHQVSVAQVLERKRPFVVVFATPTFCTSRLCGPVTEEVASLYPRYHERVDFIHIEPYELGPLRKEGLFQLSPYTKEWDLPTEPWVFVVNSQGRLSAKFEGLVTREEVETALQKMLGG